ncbi:MAG: Sir2 family NAD-dependent protein deacetylase [Sterolibacterium sp.]|jgi:NAD-dependent SIR2 family protein deacetylase
MNRQFAANNSTAEIPAPVCAALREARHVVIFTGAGISAESGIPTFRDALTGLWENFDAETLATPAACRVRHCDLMFSIGTSSVVYPAAALPFEAAARGAKVIQVNPVATELDEVAYCNLSIAGFRPGLPNP